ETFQADRTARVNLVGGDTDLGAQTILKTVGEARRSIDHDRARIDLAQEAAAARVILGDDAVGVLRTVGIDVIDGGIEAGDDADRQYRRQVLGAPVLLRRGVRGPDQRPRLLASAQLDTPLNQCFAQARQYLRGNGP